MLKYEHLIGKEFNYKSQNCFHLVRDFYADNFGILLPNYACPKDFWEHDLNLYMDRHRTCGFYPIDIHPSEYRPGDIILCAIHSKVANHIGVFVENGQVLHHLWGRLSISEPYRSLLRNTTVSVMRHKDVDLVQVESTASLLDYVSPRVKRKLDEHLASSVPL